jgi:hypothetical protein
MEDLRLEHWSQMRARKSDEPVEVNLNKLLPDHEDIEQKLSFLEQKEYKLSIFVQDVEGYEEDMLDVELRLSWKATNGTRHQRSVRTVYTKDGLYDYYYTLARPSE